MGFVDKNCIVFVFFLFGCSKSIPITIKNVPEKYVLHCLFDNARPFKVSVQKSTSIKDSVVSVDLTENIKGVILENGLFFDSLKPKKDNKFHSSKKPSFGNNYTCEIFLNDSLILSASDDLPIASTTLATVRIDAATLVDFFDKQSLVSLQANPIEILIAKDKEKFVHYRIKTGWYNNYYFELDSNLNMDFFKQTSILTDDKWRITKGQSSLMFDISNDTDTFQINGGVDGLLSTNYLVDSSNLILYNFPFSSQVPYLLQGYPNRPSWEYSHYLIVEELSDAYFKFVESYVIQQYSLNDPYATPINVYSNVKGGVGIFAGAVFKRVKI